MPSMDEVEKQVKELGLNAMRVSKEEALAAVVSETYTTLPSQRTIVCQLTLRNGYTVQGMSSVVSIENFNETVGKGIARDNAMRDVFMLLGFMKVEDRHRNRERLRIYTDEEGQLQYSGDFRVESDVATVLEFHQPYRGLPRVELLQPGVSPIFELDRSYKQLGVLTVEPGLGFYSVIADICGDRIAPEEFMLEISLLIEEVTPVAILEAVRLVEGTVLSASNSRLKDGGRQVKYRPWTHQITGGKLLLYSSVAACWYHS